MASDRKLNIYNEDNVTINVVEESDNQLTIINESPTVEVITIYEQGPQGPRGEKGEGADLPTEIISGSGANNLLALFVNSGYITGSKNLSFDGSQLSVTGSIDGLSHIDFSTSSYSTNAPARITWNPDFGTLDLGVVGGNVNLSWGLEVAAYVVNGEADTLVDGEVVYMSGSRGDKPKVYRASSVTELTSTKTFGVVTEPISSNQLGYVTTQGVVNGLNLSSFNPGDAVWLGTTPGTFTATKPQAPTHSVFVGIVQRANAGAGQLYVRVQNGYEIDELHNVRITNPLNGQLLTYNQAQQIWANGNTLSGSYFVSGSIQATAFTGSLLGTASYADIIRSGGVLGSGGANQVAFWSGTGSLTGNSLMLVESANNRFRIGNIYYGTSGITTTQGGSAASIFMSSANRNINMDGNVGIGTSPVAVLHVSGSSGSGLFEIDSNSSQNILFVSGSGNIGIGINNPAYRLDVSGTTQVRDSLRIVRSDNNSFVTSIYQSSVAGLNFEGTSFDFQRAGTTFARLAQNSTVTYWVHRMNINVPNVITDIGAALGVRGSGTTSATTTFRAENSAGTAGFFVRDDGYFFNGDSTFQVRPYAAGGTTAIISNGGHNNAQGLQVTSAVGIVAASSLGISVNNVYGASIYAQGGSSGGNVSLGLLSNRALISAGNGRSMQPSAMLQVESTTLGFLLPRMTSTQRDAIASSSQGLMVYTTTPADEGVYYYNSGSSYQGWTRLLNSSGSQTLTGSLDILGTLNTSVYSGSSAYISGDVYVGGKVTAQEFYTQYVSSSIIYQSGSTKFGDSLDDIHQRTGSMSVTGSVNIAGNLNSTGDTRLTIGSGTSFKLQGALGGALTYAYAEYIGSQYTAGLKSDTNMSFRSADTSRIYISNTNLPQGITLFGNNLGLNVLTPTAKLHISGSSGSGLFEIDSDSVQNIIYVSGSGNVGIRTNTPEYSLDVIGNGRFKGLGTTAATTTFRVENNSGLAALRVLDNGVTYINSLRTSTILGDASNLTIEAGTSGNYVAFKPFLASSAFIFGLGFDDASTSSERNTIDITQGFIPTNGTAVRNFFRLSSIVSQSGTATGTSRGIYLAPVLTSAANWRSIEWTNNTGYGLYGRGTAPNFLSGSLTLANGLTVTGSVTSTTGFTGSYKGDISPQSTINGNPVIDMYTAIAFSVAL